MGKKKIPLKFLSFPEGEKRKDEGGWDVGCGNENVGNNTPGKSSSQDSAFIEQRM